MTTPTLRRYEVRTEKGSWLADIVVGSDGWLGIVSDYGDYAHSWKNFGDVDFRAFLAGLNTGYLLCKLSTKSEYDAAATEARVKAAVAECEGEPAEKERELLEESEFDAPETFFLWHRETSIDDTSGLAAYDYPGDAKRFAEIVWPRFAAMLRAELAAEPTPLDSAVAIVQSGLVLVDAIVRSGPLFLGVSRKHDHADMGCPGGKVKPGESLEGACLRELFEETGYVGRIIRQVHSGPSTHGTCTAFLVEIVGVGQRAPGETGRVAWVPAEELYAGSFGRFYREALREFDVPPVAPAPRSVAFRKWLADLETLRANALAALDAIHERAAETGFDKLTDDEIQAEVDAVRAEMRAAPRCPTCKAPVADVPTDEKPHHDAMVEHHDCLSPSRGVRWTLPEPVKTSADGHCIPAFPAVNTFLTPGGAPPAGWPKADTETR